MTNLATDKQRLFILDLIQRRDGGRRLFTMNDAAGPLGIRPFEARQMTSAEASRFINQLKREVAA